MTGPAPSQRDPELAAELNEQRRQSYNAETQRTRPAVPEPVTYTLPVPVDEQRPLPEFQMVACAEHLLAGHRWRCRACRTEVERQFRECCEELWRLQRATTPSPPADAQPSHPAPDGGGMVSIDEGTAARIVTLAGYAVVASLGYPEAAGIARSADAVLPVVESLVTDSYLATWNFTRTPPAPPLSGEGRDERPGICPVEAQTFDSSSHCRHWLDDEQPCHWCGYNGDGDTTCTARPASGRDST